MGLQISERPRKVWLGLRFFVISFFLYRAMFLNLHICVVNSKSMQEEPPNTICIGSKNVLD
jgi:hypothetical protein